MPTGFAKSVTVVLEPSLNWIVALTFAVVWPRSCQTPAQAQTRATAKIEENSFIGTFRWVFTRLPLKRRRAPRKRGKVFIMDADVEMVRAPGTTETVARQLRVIHNRFPIFFKKISNFRLQQLNN
jgi:hypothetical protein